MRTTTPEARFVHAGAMKNIRGNGGHFDGSYTAEEALPFVNRIRLSGRFWQRLHPAPRSVARRISVGEPAGRAAYRSSAVGVSIYNFVAPECGCKNDPLRNTARAHAHVRKSVPVCLHTCMRTLCARTRADVSRKRAQTYPRLTSDIARVREIRG